MFLLFFHDFLMWFSHFIQKLPFFNALEDTTKIKNYISDSNRLTMYILGTTVSANIYLYNTKTKISSSSIWESKQLFYLLLNLIVNLALVLLGFHLIHSELIYDINLPLSKLKILLVFHFVLVICSYFLFGITLINFIKSFWLTSNMKKLHKDINKLLFPKRWFNLFKNIIPILKQADNNFYRILGLIKFKNDKFDKIKLFIQNFKKINIFSRIAVYCRYLNRLFYFVYIIIIRNHKLIEQSSTIRSKEIKRLSSTIEVLYQNIEYIILSKSEKGMNEYCKEWNALFSKAVIMMFHIKTNEKNEKDMIELYRLLIHSHSKLISSTSNTYEQRKFHKQFITTLFTGLVYKEEYFSTEYFDKRSQHLEKVYFDELLILFINLMKNKKFDIFTSLQNDEINFNALLASNQDNKEFYGNEKRKKNYEALFTSLIIKMVELNITEHFTTVMAVIFSLRDEVIDLPSNDKQLIVNLPKSKPNKLEESNDEKMRVKLSTENKKDLIIATIKANEQENYKAAGYIVKLLSSNIPFNHLEDTIEEIRVTFNTSRNIQYDTGIYKVDFNDYSFTYCLDKTFVLLCAQYYLKNDLSFLPAFNTVIDQIDYKYFLKKLEKKNKEYNMVALEETQLEQFKNLLEPKPKLNTKPTTV